MFRVMRSRTPVIPRRTRYAGQFGQHGGNGDGPEYVYWNLLEQDCSTAERTKQGKAWWWGSPVAEAQQVKFRQPQEQGLWTGSVSLEKQKDPEELLEYETTIITLVRSFEPGTARKVPVLKLSIQERSTRVLPVLRPRAK